MLYYSLSWLQQVHRAMFVSETSFHTCECYNYWAFNLLQNSKSYIQEIGCVVLRQMLKAGQEMKPGQYIGCYRSQSLYLLAEFTKHFRLEKTSKIIKSNFNQPPPCKLDHSGKCHIQMSNPFFNSLRDTDSNISKAWQPCPVFPFFHCVKLGT